MTVLAWHWDARYARGVDELSWTQDHPVTTLDGVDRLGLAPTEGVIDAGGGASSLTPTLLRRGFSDLTVVDVSPTAIELARRALGEDAEAVTWVTADLRDWVPNRTYDVWHDRAVWHFLVDEASRGAYRAALHRALPPGGALIVEAFAADGPDTCSGLPVRRYTIGCLEVTFGDEFLPVAAGSYTHYTPSTIPQPFVWTAMRRQR